MPLNKGAAYRTVRRMAPSRKWHILKGAVHVTAEDLQRVRRNILTQPRDCVINPDQLRLQKRIPRSDELVARMEEALRSNGYLDDKSLRTPVILHSLAGCSQQQWHLDFQPNPASDTNPMGALLALEANTRFETRKRTLELDVGDLLVFDGGLVHAGAAYRDDNTRLHAYLYPRGGRRLPNQIFLVL